ncbi:hypothetical protein LCGC14_2451490 [marine sediment metagenome]|uniref:Uncharacterized protein n=1 Tax=marine sediment metagenome TaxID=412755 RepID=A0A0F9C3J5_9ZZZZ
MKTKLSIIIGLLVVFGCATSPVGKAYDVLYSAAVIYDTALTYAGDEYRAGRISEEEKKMIVAYADRYRLAVRAGQSALRAYKQAELIGDDVSASEKGLRTALDVVVAAQGILTEYIQLSAGGDL